VVDNSNAQAGCLVELHPVGELHWLYPLAFDDDGREQPIFNPFNSFFEPVHILWSADTPCRAELFRRWRRRLVRASGQAH